MRLPLALIGALIALAFSPTGANAAVQEPWVLPAGDLSEIGQDADEPQIAIAPDGSATAVWKRFVETNYLIQTATRPPNGPFGAPLNLSEEGESASEPQIAIGADGSAVAVWKRLNGSDLIAQATIRPPGGTFAPPVDLSASGQDTFDPQVAVGDDGSAVAVWERDTGSHHIIQAASRPPGGTFAPAVNLSPSGVTAYDPQVAIGGDGSTAVVWRQKAGSDFIVKARIRLQGGAFTPAENLSASGETTYEPQVAIGGDGNAVASWRRLGGSGYIAQAASRPPGGGFGAAVNLSLPGASAYGPRVAIGGDDSAVVVWYRYNGSNDIVQASTRPPGGAFTAPKNLSVPGGTAIDPQIAIAPDGTATAVWTRNNGTDDIVQAVTRPPGGAFAAPVDLSAVGEYAALPQLAIGAENRATAIWSRFNGTETIVQAASTGQPKYALNLTRSGNGQGTVSSTPAGIDCGNGCTSKFGRFTTVTLTATAHPGSKFTGWAGACSGSTSTCEVTMLQAEAVEAGFTLKPPTPPPPPKCEKATIKIGKFKKNRKRGTGRLKVRAGAAGRVILRGSKKVRKSSKKLKKKGTVRLRVRARGKTLKKLRRRSRTGRRGSVKVKVRVVFWPRNDCKKKTRHRKVKLVKRHRR